MSNMRTRDLFAPFRVAISGLVYTFRTQRHMRFHIYVVLLVTLMGVLFNLRLREILILLFTISLVLVAEMFNSAIEAVVDLVQPTFHPLARFAKDIAAGAVLITTMLAIAVGALMLLGENRLEEIRISLTGEAPNVAVVQRMILGFLLLFLVVIIGKAVGKRGLLLRGGLVSGHAAFGFFLATTATLLTEHALVAGICILLAVVVAQSRWEAKIHSVFELTLGATVGTLMALALFAMMPK
ncbi:MAG: diacylglycerol kinase [Fimbriimonadaceae bacterium]|nr:diacylglycerol kinase [Fimbriimonadaceae bacterium]